MASYFHKCKQILQLVWMYWYVPALLCSSNNVKIRSQRRGSITTLHRKLQLQIKLSLVLPNRKRNPQPGTGFGINILFLWNYLYYNAACNFSMLRVLSFLKHPGYGLATINVHVLIVWELTFLISEGSLYIYIDRILGLRSQYTAHVCN